MSRVRLTAFRVSLLSTLGVVLLYVWAAHSTLLRNLEAKALDLRFHLRGAQQAEAPVVLVVIDDRSIAELGRWPWSRSRFAAMVRRLHAAGAKVVAFDLLFSEAETGIEPRLLNQLHRALSAFQGLQQAPQRDALESLMQRLSEANEADVALAAAMREAGNVVLPFAIAAGHPSGHLQAAHTASPILIAPAAYRTLRHLPAERPSVALRGRMLLTPIAPIATSAVALGHVDVGFDSDGTPRYDYPVAEYQGEYYASLAVQVARIYLGLRPEEMVVRFGEGIQLGAISIPTDGAMRLLVNYLGPSGTVSTYAFVDVLQGRVPETLFHDAIVLIGGTASGLTDTFVTPYTATLAGVERHATIIDSILRQAFLRRSETMVLLDLAAILGLGLLVGWLSPRCPTYWGSVVAVGLGGLYATANVLAFTRAGLWINLLFPLGAVMVNQSALALFGYLTEARQKRQIRQAFQYYLHPAIVERIARNPQFLRLGGESRELTVLFADIRGFSAIAESMSPEALVQLLNEYFTIMTRVVFQHHGLLDKYLGDGILAVYGVPLHDPEHPVQACCSALDMLAELKTLQACWATRGLPALDIGIGINTATMVVGNMGSAQRFDYTVMGDGVNLASRLENANKTYGTHVIISETTWERVRGRLATRELDIVRVPGKAQPTRIFEVLGLAPLPAAGAALASAFEGALGLYRAQQWPEARQAFQQVLAAVPDDPPSRLYVERCQAHMLASPRPGWDGVHLIQGK